MRATHSEILVAFYEVRAELDKNCYVYLTLLVHIHQVLENINIEVSTIRNRIWNPEITRLLFSIALLIRVTLCWYTREYWVLIAENQHICSVCYIDAYYNKKNTGYVRHSKQPLTLTRFVHHSLWAPEIEKTRSEITWKMWTILWMAKIDHCNVWILYHVL